MSKQHKCEWCGKEIKDGAEWEERTENCWNICKGFCNRATVFVRTNTKYYGHNIAQVKKFDICFDCLNDFLSRCSQKGKNTEED